MSLTNHFVPVPGSPIIPDGSFADQKGVGKSVSQILSLIPDEQIQELGTQLVFLKEAASLLRTSADEYLSLQTAYNFRNYGKRLLISQRTICDILEREIFRNNGVLTPVGSAFYSYLSLVTGSDTQDVDTFTLKIVQEFGLARLVYESDQDFLGPVDEVNDYEFQHDDDISEERFLSSIRNAWKSEVNHCQIYYNRRVDAATVKQHFEAVTLNKKLKTFKVRFYGGHINCDEAIERLRMARDLGLPNLSFVGSHFLKTWPADDVIRFLKEIKRLNAESILPTSYLDLSSWTAAQSYTMDSEDMLKIIRAVGLAGIVDLDLSRGEFVRQFQADIGFFTKLVEIAGRSGIKSLNLNMTYLFREASLAEILTFFSTAGRSGIKKLDVGFNGLAKIVDFKNLVEFVTVAGEAGIRDLDLSNNDYENIPAASDLSDFTNIVEAAGRAGIKTFHFGSNGFQGVAIRASERERNYLNFFATAGAAGMKNLDFTIDHLNEILSDDAPLIKIIRSYGMQLVYGSVHCQNPTYVS